MVTDSAGPPVPPMPGPDALMIRLLPQTAKMLMLMQQGEPKLSVAVNGYPLLPMAHRERNPKTAWPQPITSSSH
jgi:hypothetical protein